MALVELTEATVDVDELTIHSAEETVSFAIHINDKANAQIS